MAQIDGGEMLVRVLVQHGVREVFTLHGGHVDAIYQAAGDRLRFIDTRHPLTEKWRSWSFGHNFTEMIPAAARDVVTANQRLRPEHGLAVLDAKWVIACDDASFQPPPRPDSGRASVLRFRLAPQVDLPTREIGREAFCPFLPKASESRSSGTITSVARPPSSSSMMIFDAVADAG